MSDIYAELEEDVLSLQMANNVDSDNPDKADEQNKQSDSAGSKRPNLLQKGADFVSSMISRNQATPPSTSEKTFEQRSLEEI